MIFNIVSESKILKVKHLTCKYMGWISILIYSIIVFHLRSSSILVRGWCIVKFFGLLGEHGVNNNTYILKFFGLLGELGVSHQATFSSLIRPAALSE